MKLTSLIALLSFSLCFAQEYIPPNGIPLKDNLFIDATEVANIHWMEYEYYIRQDSGDAYADSMLPNKELTKNYRSDYYGAPIYRYFPVIGLTYEQVKNYNNWRTIVVNRQLENDDKSWRVKFRLPTEEEWELAARTTDTISYTKPRVCYVATLMKGGRREIKKIFPNKNIDFKELKMELSEYEESEVLSFVLDEKKPWFIVGDEKQPQNVRNSIFELEHMVGNVAEMVQEKGIVKGGSWRHILATSFPFKRSEIDPEKVYDWVGFRCVSEVYELDTD